jgi:hypothetical protein
VLEAAQERVARVHLASDCERGARGAQRDVRGVRVWGGRGGAGGSEFAFQRDRGSSESRRGPKPATPADCDACECAPDGPASSIGEVTVCDPRDEVHDRGFSDALLIRLRVAERRVPSRTRVPVDSHNPMRDERAPSTWARIGDHIAEANITRLVDAHREQAPGRNEREHAAPGRRDDARGRVQSWRVRRHFRRGYPDKIASALVSGALVR